MRKAALFLLTLWILLSMGGCGSQSSAPSSQAMNTVPASVPVSLTVTDTPPAGVTVLFFQLSVTGATLSPGNVSLLSSTNPIPVNVSQLQADTAFLGTANVPAGTYTGLNLTFGSDSKLTIFNASGSTIGSGASACANDTVCILTPTATNLSLSFSTAPFPVTLVASTPLAIKLDIHLDKVIQSDLSVDLGAANGI